MSEIDGGSVRPGVAAEPTGRTERAGHIVTIVDAVPLSRAGLEHALRSSGFRVRHAEAIPADRSDVSAFVVMVRGRVDLERVRDVAAADPGRPCVALVDDHTPAAVANVLRFGAAACVSWTAEVRDIVDVIDQSIAGRTVMSTEIIRWMATRLPSGQHADVLPPEDVERLRLLSTGMTVATLADRVGYSERTMYRMLQDLYSRMRVDNRRAAVSLAHEWGCSPDNRSLDRRRRPSSTPARQEPASMMRSMRTASAAPSRHPVAPAGR